MTETAGLQALWLDVFADEPSYTEDFLTSVLPASVCLCDDLHVPRSALYLIPGRLGKEAACYLFAASTAAGSRGLGLMSRLLRQACEWAERRDSWLFTVPAEASLFDFYARFGFRPLAAKQQPGTAASLSFSRTDPSFFAARRVRRACEWRPTAAFASFCLRHYDGEALLIDGRYRVLGKPDGHGGFAVEAGYVPACRLCGTRRLRPELAVWCPPGKSVPAGMEAFLLQNE